jgi:hypothetical protein
VSCSRPNESGSIVYEPLGLGGGKMVVMGDAVTIGDADGEPAGAGANGLARQFATAQRGCESANG